MLDSITSDLVGVSSRDFYQSTSREAGMIIWVQFLQCSPPKICDGQNIVQFFSDFSQLWTLIANISGTAEDMQNPPTLQTMAIPPAFNEKSPVYFGPLTAWNYM